MKEFFQVVLVPKFKVDHVPTHQISISFSWKNAFTNATGSESELTSFLLQEWFELVRGCSRVFSAFCCWPVDGETPCIAQSVIYCIIIPEVLLAF